MSTFDSTIIRLSRWSAGVRFEDIPAPVLTAAQRCIIDTLGVALAGSVTATARHARTVAVLTAKPDHSSIIGDGQRLSAPAAAFANAVSGHALDFDDNCNAGFVHGSAVIWPAALAVAQMHDLDGAKLLTAFVVGAECQYALAQTLTGVVYDKGWWTTGLFGALGACAAACHAMGLDAERSAAAMGIALAGSSGLKAGFGTDAKTLVAGRASELGVTAALLAAQGCSGPSDVVEHPRGMASMFGQGIVVPVEGLGQVWRLLDPGVDIKRIPVCMSSHAAVDALLELFACHGLQAADVAEVVCDVPGIVMQNLPYLQPGSPQQAQFSLPFALACTAVEGEVTLGALSQRVIDDTHIQGWMQRVRMHTSERWTASLLEAAPEGAWVKVVTTDGRVFERFRARHRGSASDPLPFDELRGKFLSCASHMLPASDAQALFQRLEQLKHLAGARTLFSS